MALSQGELSVVVPQCFVAQAFRGVESLQLG
jgi:hypothetical protein